MTTRAHTSATARLRTLVVLVAAALGGAACVPTPPLPPPPAVRVVEAPSSIDATGRSDVTARLNEFVRSVPDRSVIELPRKGRYRVEGTLLLRNRSGLTVDGNGTTIFATTTGGRARSHVRVEDGRDITVTDLVVKGVNPHAGTGPLAYDAAREHQHGFDIRSSQGIELIRVTVLNTYGDLVYLGPREDGSWTSDVVIRNSTLVGSGRQGIALTAARNVTIEDNVVSGTGRSTFDLEPGGGRFGVEDVRIRRNSVGPGRLLFVAAAGRGPVNDVLVEGNTVRGRPLSVHLAAGDGTLRRNWRILGNRTDDVSGNPHRALMTFHRVRDVLVRGNYQRFDPRRLMHGARISDSCNVVVSGNDFPGSVGQSRQSGTC